jgi:GNAT superfamily N-acetyltransferase
MTLELQFRPLKAPVSSKALADYRKDGNLPAPPPRTTPQDARGKVQWVSVEVKNKQIGIARLELAPPQFCFVTDLIVLSKFRGQGVGSWFLGKIEQYCLGVGIRRLLLEAAEGTDAFYASQGFAIDPLVPTLLKKDLNPTLRKMFVPPGR